MFAKAGKRLFCLSRQGWHIQIPIIDQYITVLLQRYDTIGWNRCGCGRSMGSSGRRSHSHTPVHSPWMTRLSKEDPTARPKPLWLIFMEVQLRNPATRCQMNQVLHACIRAHVVGVFCTKTLNGTQVEAQSRCGHTKRRDKASKRAPLANVEFAPRINLIAVLWFESRGR